jgi:hypothetical protein
MTIHADWAKVFKTRLPAAFSTQPPHAANIQAGIIDGHIQIMGAYSPPTWDDFLNAQFVRPITRLFGLGVRVVVLLFDNRLAVPPYKGMTQQKRCTRYNDVVFTPADHLPLNIPTEQWSEYMMNRHFKDKVISLVCERIQSLIKPTHDHALIVDFKGPPKLYTSPIACPIDVPGITELGESDVKYVRYVHMLGNSIVCATDGDYIPIALLYYATHGMRPDNNIYLYRQLANIDALSSSASSSSSRPRKSTLAANTAPAHPRTAKRRGRIMVAPLTHPPSHTHTHTPTHVACIFFAVCTCTPKQSVSWKQEYTNMQPIARAITSWGHPTACNMHMQPAHSLTAFVAMMLLAGTDYSRPTPLVGPKRIIDMLSHLFPHMLRTLTVSSGLISVSPHRLANDLVAAIYISAFNKHIPYGPGPAAPIHRVLNTLQNAKLSAHIKSLLPAQEQVLVTCANVTWVLHYWKVPPTHTHTHTPACM